MRSRWRVQPAPVVLKSDPEGGWGAVIGSQAPRKQAKLQVLFFSPYFTAFFFLSPESWGWATGNFQDRQISVSLGAPPDPGLSRHLHHSNDLAELALTSESLTFPEGLLPPAATLRGRGSALPQSRLWLANTSEGPFQLAPPRLPAAAAPRYAHGQGDLFPRPFRYSSPRPLSGIVNPSHFKASVRNASVSSR